MSWRFHVHKESGEKQQSSLRVFAALGLLCKGAVTTSLQCDDLHVTVPHCYTADADAVEAEKVKLKMQTHVHYICAPRGRCWSQDLRRQQAKSV